MLVEVAVRLGDSLLEVTRLPHGKTYISPITGKPLVTSMPRGFAVAGRALTEPVEVTDGLVTFSIARVTRALPLERRPMDRRPIPFAVLSLIAHAAVVAVALASAQLDPITVPVVKLSPDRRPVQLVVVPPPEKKKPLQKKPAATQPAATEAAPPVSPREAGIAGSASLDDLSMVTGKADLTKDVSDATLYDEQAANEQNFGNSNGHFDPQHDHAFDSVATGRYATTASGRGAGENYRLPAHVTEHGTHAEVERPPLMALACDDNTCVVEGAMDRFKVRDIIEKRYVDLVKCYEPSAHANPHLEITLQFDIGTDGRPSDVHSDGAVGSCVARIVQRTKFPTSDQPTRVTRYPMAFWKT